MQPHGNTIGIFEYRYMRRSFHLHRHGMNAEEARRGGTDRVEVDVGNLKAEDGMWVLTIPAAAQDGGQVRATKMVGWSVVAPDGVFRHPDDALRVWKPIAQTRDLLADVLPKGSAAWINDHLAADQQGCAVVERLLRKLEDIPWVEIGEQLPREIAEQKEVLVQVNLRAVKERTDTLTSELEGLRDQVADLREKHDELQSSVDELRNIDESLAPQRVEKAELEGAVSALERRKGELTELSTELNGQISGYRQQLRHYRRYIEAKDASAVDREPRAEQWGPGEETDALKEVKRCMEAEGREMLWVDLLTLHLALQHAPFTILQGNPGAGKTSALQRYAHHIGMCSDAPIAVNTAWMTQDDVLGHYDMLTKEFVEGELGRVLLAHQPSDLGETRRVRLAILDEINLVTVEHVFSGIMSALALDDADKQTVTLHRQSGEKLPPRALAWPDGLLLAGTANNDHTVVAFSDRFRDRSVIHTLLPLAQDVILAASLRERKEDILKVEPAKDLTCQTWAAWKADTGSAPSNAGEERDDLTSLIREFVSKVPANQLSVRSLRRGASMAKHALRLIRSLDAELASLKMSIPEQAPPEVDKSLAVSLGLLPTLVQRTMHLRKPGHEQAELVDGLRPLIHPALAAHLEALKG